ncbi:hypothetical protein [Citricoccus sp. I39-566]|uniref:hypothetical protein n=1 Tax=Citricoccus sp. I39-566 TaxID=3073268 RepID=UPI00286AD88B|nr:hypothetical protein [Citricoccus sp. I39-566]WMY79067.1 hypothetical protein RE421_04150 [Citricoccus sp. I39-566]
MPPWTHGPTPRTWPARRASEGSHFVRALFAFGLTTAVLVWLAFVVTNNWETLPTILGLVVFGIGQGALVTLVFNVLVTAAPKDLAGDVGSIRGTAQNLASAVGTAVMGAVLVTVLSTGISQAVDEHPVLPPELVAQVDLDNANVVNNEDLRALLEDTTASPEQVEAAVALNEEQRLRTLKLGFLLQAAVSVVAAIPASRLPRYRPGEIPAQAQASAGRISPAGDYSGLVSCGRSSSRGSSACCPLASGVLSTRSASLPAASARARRPRPVSSRPRSANCRAVLCRSAGLWWFWRNSLSFWVVVSAV